MENKITELVFILDKSGSMAGKEEDTIGGFNSMIERQKGQEGEVLVSTILFSTYSKILHDRKSISQMQPLTKEDYVVGGATALLDAIGGAINHIGTIHKYARLEDVPQKTIFIITTDGMENASCKYSSDKVKQMITFQKENHGWEFLFLAANIDAVEAAETIGIDSDRSANFDESYTGMVFCELAEEISHFRKCGEIRDGWAKNIEKDIKKSKINDNNNLTKENDIMGFVGEIIKHEKYGYGKIKDFGVDPEKIINRIKGCIQIKVEFNDCEREFNINKETAHTIKFINNQKQDEFLLIIDHITGVWDNGTGQGSGIKTGTEIGKNNPGVYIYKSHADFLNKKFGTNYKGYQRSSWEYNINTIVWMVHIDGSVHRGWSNTVSADGNRILEDYVGDPQEQLLNHRTVVHDYRIAVDVSKNYKILGVYKIDRASSDERFCRKWNKVRDFE